MEGHDQLCEADLSIHPEQNIFQDISQYLRSGTLKASMG